MPRFQQVAVQKITKHYRIVTDLPNNWYIVANRDIAEGELVIPSGETFHDVLDAEFLEIVLRETGETRRVAKSVVAVPDSGCDQAILEIPWCLMNHSCAPNTIERWSQEAPYNLRLAKTEASKDIRAGEELTCDYALEQYEYAADQSCWCGAPEHCRGVITGFRGLDETTKARLIHKASPYVRDRYLGDRERERQARLAEHLNRPNRSDSQQNLIVEV